VRAFLVSVLLTGIALAQPQTQNLHLLLGSQARDNQNWQTLDTALCGGQKPLVCPNGTAVLPPTVVTFGADPTGGTDSSAGFQNFVNTGGGIITVPDGTYQLCTIRLNSSNQVIRCSPNAVFVPSATCVGGVAFAQSTTTEATNVTIDGCTFKGTTAPGTWFTAIDVNGTFLSGLHIRNNTFDLTTGVTGVITRGLRDVDFDHNKCFAAGTGGGVGGTTHNIHSTCFETFAGGGTVRVTNNTSDFTYNGIILANQYLGDTDSILVEGNQIDLGWTHEPTQFTGSGGTVTYTATVLTDTAATFTGLTNLTDVYVLPVRASGTTTACVSTSAARLCDSGNNFFTAGVRRGDVVEFGNTFATIVNDAVNAGCASGTCNQQVFVDQWRDKTTYKPAAAPAVGSSYTIYQFLTCQVNGVTATTITCTGNTGGFEDFYGNLVTPPAGTLYRVGTDHPNYAIQVDASGGGMRQVQIMNNRVHRSWSDAISVNGGSQMKIEGNMVDDSMDACTTVFSPNATVVGNTYFHCGSTGTFVASSDANLTGNMYIDNGWHNRNATTALGHDVDVGSGVNNALISNNTMEKLDATETNDLVGVYLHSDTNTVLMNNHMGGHVTADIHLATTSSGPKLYYNHAATLLDDGATTPLLIDPEYSVAFASLPNYALGSLMKCSDCTTAAPCAAAGTGSIARYVGGAKNCN